MSAPPSPTLSDSALLDSLEDDPRFDLVGEREKRIEEIKEQAAKVRAMQEREASYTGAAAGGSAGGGAGWGAGADEGYGRVVTFRDEKTLLQRMAKEKYCLIHFFHPDFARCRIMDERLDELAPKYPHTLFCRASVADVPFSVTKFSVQVLPDVHVFVDGRCVDRLIGFEDLGQSDKFTAAALEFRLAATGALPKGKMTLAGALRDNLGMGGDGDEEEEERSDGEEERRRGGRGNGNGSGSGRRGKVGIRDGLWSGTKDEDEWD